MTLDYNIIFDGREEMVMYVCTSSFVMRPLDLYNDI